MLDLQRGFDNQAKVTVSKMSSVEVGGENLYTPSSVQTLFIVEGAIA